MLGESGLEQARRARSDASRWRDPQHRGRLANVSVGARNRRTVWPMREACLPARTAGSVPSCGNSVRSKSPRPICACRGRRRPAAIDDDDYESGLAAGQSGPDADGRPAQSAARALEAASSAHAVMARRSVPRSAESMRDSIADRRLSTADPW